MAEPARRLYLEDDSGPGEHRRFGVVRDDGSIRTAGHTFEVSDQYEGTEDPINARPHLRAVPGSGRSDGVRRGNLSAVPDEEDIPSVSSAQSLRSQEEHPGNDYGTSALDDVREKLGLGFTGEGSKKSEKLSSLFKSNSRLKKRIAIAVAAGGAGAGGIALLFSFMLPLRVATIVNTLEAHYMAQANQALSKTASNAFTEYVRKSVMPALGKPGCGRTIDPGCVVVANGTSPFGKVYAAWAKNKLELELAQKHGLIIGKSSSGKFFLNMDGRDVDLTDIWNGNKTFWDLEGTQDISRNDLRRIVNQKFKEGTLWDKTYKRFVVNNYLKKQLGIRHCLGRCMWTDKASEGIDSVKATVADKKMAYKSWWIQRMVPEKYQLIPLCMLSPESCSSSLDPARPGDDLRLSPAQKELKSLVEKAAARFAGTSLEGLAKALRESPDGNLNSYLTKEVTKYLVEKITGKAAAGEAAAASAAKLVPVVGWALAAVQSVQTLQNAPETIRFMMYATNTATSVAQASMFSTIVSEQFSGNTDGDIVGSFDQAFTTEAPDGGALASNADSHPLWSAVMLGKAPSASYYTQSPNAYRCNDGRPVPKDRLVCVDEEPAQSIALLDLAVEARDATAPFQRGLTTILGTVIDILLNIGGKALMLACNDTINPQCAMTLKVLETIAEPFTEKILEWATNLITILAKPPHRPDGGRTFGTTVMGYDAIGNIIVRDTLGGLPGSPATIGAIRNEYLADERAMFTRKPLLSRLFDKNSTNSLVSQVALATPQGSYGGLQPLAASTLFEPIGQLSSSFSSIFSPTKAYATGALSAQVAAAFKIPQYYVPEAEIPDRPLEYWDANCSQDYDATTKRLDVSRWLNDTTVRNDYTGEQKNTITNPCLLLQNAAIGIGAQFGADIIPADSVASDYGSTPSSPTNSTTSSNPQGLAKQILASGKVTGDSRYISQIQAYANGDFSCHINTSILQLIATAMQNHSLQISSLNRQCTGVLTDSGTNSYHWRDSGGHAIDFKAIDGKAVTGGDATSLNFLREILPTLPSGSATGQSGCRPRGALTLPTGIIEFSDSCNHVHLQVPIDAGTV